MRFFRISRKPLAVILAWFFWWVPIGLHRIVMRQKYWWVHTVLFVTATSASTKFFYNSYNIKIGRHFMDTGVVPPLGTYANTWLLVFGAIWFLFVFYDQLAVFFWPSPDRSADHE